MGKLIESLNLWTFFCVDFWKEYEEAVDCGVYRKARLWKKFIEDKDLGLVCKNFKQDVYEIYDEKKWVLSRLKYGI